ncbi:sensor histidine kinase [Polaromonas sp.]|uniref:sensor histidine kinase n=1 Tax=Polaromonas sp. TaxID=1869339 RepID=UPI003CB18D24
MKPEPAACWRARNPPAGWLVAWVLVCIAGCGQAPGDGAAIQIKRAQMLQTASMGFTPAPSTVDATSLPQELWQTVALPHMAPRKPPPQSPYETPTVTEWYRLDLDGMGPWPEAPFLYIPRWKNGGHIAVYGDDKLLYQTEGSLTYNGYNRPLLIRLANGATTPSPAAVLLRLTRQPGNGSAVSTVWVGVAKSLAWRYQMRHFLQIELPFMGAASFLAVGFFSLAIWLRRQHEWLYLLFFAASAMAFLRMLHYFIGGSYLPMSDAWFNWLTVASLLWLIVLVNHFLERLHRRPLRWLTPSLVVVTLLCNAVTVPGALTLIPDLNLITPALYLTLLPLALLIFADALRHALRSREREVELMAAWVFFTVASSVYDLALQNNWVSPEGLYTNPYAIIGLFVMFSHIMYRRYTGAIGEVERANANLAQRLQARESELEQSHQRLRAVEQQQMLSNERQRLMQDMHDGLGSSLTSAIRSVERGGMSDARMTQVLKDCMDDLKLAIDSMEPVEADLLLLLATLRFRLEPRLEDTGVALLWEINELPTLDWLDPSAALHILRIVQESVANILRHTHATEIRVSTASEGAGVQVIIEDNGQGFDVEKALSEATGRGLSNQQRRAQAIDGTVAWISGPAGTRFTLWLPLQRAAAVALQPDL